MRRDARVWRHGRGRPCACRFARGPWREERRRKEKREERQGTRTRERKRSTHAASLPRGRPRPRPRRVSRTYRHSIAAALHHRDRVPRSGWLSPAAAARRAAAAAYSCVGRRAHCPHTPRHIPPPHRHPAGPARAPARARDRQRHTCIADTRSHSGVARPRPSPARHSRRIRCPPAAPRRRRRPRPDRRRAADRARGGGLIGRHAAHLAGGVLPAVRVVGAELVERFTRARQRHHARAGRHHRACAQQAYAGRGEAPARERLRLEIHGVTLHCGRAGTSRQPDTHVFTYG